MELNLVTNVINGLNFFKIGHFLRELSKFGHFGVKNDVIGQKLGEVVKKISLKFWENYFRQVYGHDFGQKCH